MKRYTIWTDELNLSRVPQVLCTFFATSKTEALLMYGRNIGLNVSKKNVKNGSLQTPKFKVHASVA